MDEGILAPLFQNESLCETFHIKMSYDHREMNLLVTRGKMQLGNGLLDECRKRS